MSGSGMRLNSRLEYHPKRVISIVGSSRSGSSLFKWALSLHPDLCSLAGEEEPYYKLAGNGYPWRSDDEFHQLDRPDYVRLLIANELHNWQSTHNRDVLQKTQCEVQPFVEPITCRLTDTLVLKTPQNVHRRGCLEELYPDAEIVYITMSRAPEATVNGLLDGWLSGQFRARLTPDGWWCFNMYPGWSWATLMERCLAQWRTSAEFIARDYADALPIQFEHVEQDWQAVVKKTWDWLGLPTYTIPDIKPPQISATYTPQPERWRKVRPWLAEIDYGV